MTATENTSPLVLSPALQAAVEAVADEEQRPALDVLHDAVKQYVRERRWQRTLAYGAGRARALGLTEADVPRVIMEHREEQRQGS